MATQYYNSYGNISPASVSLAAYTDDFSGKNVDSMQFGLEINGKDAKTDCAGIAASFGTSGFIPADGSAPVAYNAKVTALSEDIAQDTIANVIIIICGENP